MSHSSAEEFLKSRRRLDVKVQEVEVFRQAQIKLLQKASWENLGDCASNNRMRKNVQKMNDQQFQVDLAARKRKLADILNREIEEWKTELINKVETPEERQKSVIVRALALRDERERCRKKFVEECYERRWRDSCDDARTLDSKALITCINEKRNEDVTIKHHRLESDYEQEILAEAHEIAQSVAAMEGIDCGKKEKADRLQSSIVCSLDGQVRAKQDRLEAHLHHKRCDDEAEIAQIQASIEEEKEKERKRIEAAHGRISEIMDDNKQARRERRRIEERDKEIDMRLLEYALEKERREDTIKMNDKMQECDDIKAFLALKQKSADDDAVMLEREEKLIKAENDKTWDKNDVMMRRRVEAKRGLSDVVMNDRVRQIAAKETSIKQFKQEEDEIGRRIVNQAREDMSKDEEKVALRRAAKKKEADLLMLQIADNEARSEGQRQVQFLEEKRMTRMEAEHLNMLKSQAGYARTHFPISKSQLW